MSSKSIVNMIFWFNISFVNTPILFGTRKRFLMYFAYNISGVSTLFCNGSQKKRKLTLIFHFLGSTPYPQFPRRSMLIFLDVVQVRLNHNSLKNYIWSAICSYDYKNNKPGRKGPFNTKINISTPKKLKVESKEVEKSYLMYVHRTHCCKESSIFGKSDWPPSTALNGRSSGKVVSEHRAAFDVRWSWWLLTPMLR